MKVLICGATMYGMETAVRMARLGHDVRIVTDLFYPGEDLLGTMKAQTDESAGKWIDEFCGMNVPETPAAMKKALLKKLEDEKVSISFVTRYVAPLLHGERVCGAVVMLPNGLKCIPCRMIIDATITGMPSFSAVGRDTTIGKGTELIVRAALIGSEKEARAVCPEDMTVTRDRADPERICVARKCCLPKDMPPSDARFFIATRREHILKLFCGDRLRCDTAQPQALEPVAWLPRPEVPLAGFGDTGEITGDEDGLSVDRILLNGQILPFDPDRGFTAQHYDALVGEQCDILVCGAGTSGAWAALSCAESGAKTICIERCGLPGGTRALGGVIGLYCGNRNQIFQSMWEAIRAYAERISGSPESNQVLESLFLLNELTDKCEKLYVQTSLCDTLTEDGRIRGVLTAGEDGLHRIIASQFIDATGEGLLCHVAGCASAVGDGEFHMTQNYSQWNRCISERKAYRPVDQDMLDPTVDAEWDRSIRFCLENAAEYDLFEILTPRETRRIRGRNTVSLRSVARGTRWPDTIYDAYSTFDPHGRSFILEGRLGALPALGRGHFAAIPLGAIRPVELDNVFVVGKAVSCTQEGINYIRMNADAMCLGFIAGRVATMCVREKKQAEELDLHTLQSELLRQGALVRSVPETCEDQMTASELLTRILAAEDESTLNDVILARPDGLDEMLRRAMNCHCFSKRDLMEMTLMLYGDTAPAGVLCDRLAALDKKCGTVCYQDRQRDTGVIVGGVQGETDDYWQMNRLMVLLSWNHCRAAVPVLVSMLDHTVPGGEWINESSVYSSIRLDTNTIPNYDRILCLAFSIIQMPDETFRPGLERLYREVAVILAPKARVWRDYLLLKMAQAYARCGGDPQTLFDIGAIDLNYSVFCDGTARIIDQ